jgi:hypothetical protein
LIKLDFGGCSSLTILPEGLGNLTSSTELDLWGCSSLTTLPEGLGNCTSLRVLTYENVQAQIPDPGSRPGLQQLGPSATKEPFLPPEEELPPSTDYQVKPKMERRRKSTTPLELDLGMQL